MNSINSLLQLTILVVLVSSLVAKDLRTDVPWYTQVHEKGTPFNYNCTGKEDGNYEHPEKCTHYVACVNQTHAYQMACAKDANNQLLHFKVNQTSAPSLTPCDRPDIAKCPGKPNCNPDECQLKGYCQGYKQCKETGDGEGIWIDMPCGNGLFWNPDANTIHGGVCDYYGNLSPAVQDEYSCDPNCIEPECDWLQEKADECSPNYTYRKAFDGINTNGRIVPLSCPQLAGAEPLYWDQPTKTCDKCTRVKKHDGTTPCVCIHQV